MLRKIRTTGLLGLMLALTVGAAVARTADHGTQMDIGKKGEFVFHQDMKVGDVTLPAGRYRFQHRADNSGRYVLFQATKSIQDGGALAHPPSKLNAAGEVRCRVEPLDRKVKSTTVRWSKDGDGGRINRIEVKGETVTHVF